MNEGRSGRVRAMTIYLGWPAYLACSWTWCIGMYLPIVLRDMYGWSTVWAFAIPNVLGISLFGFVMGQRGRSRGLVSAYRRPMIWFSLTTIAFHVYFLSALWRWEPGPGLVFGMATALLAFLCAALSCELSDRALRRVAVGLYAFSVVVLLILLATTDTWLDATVRRTSWPVREVGHGVFHWPMFAIGLLVCPYFDLTFHRAFEATEDDDPRIPFVVFGVLFCWMLVLTCVYWSTGLTWLVTIHIVLQSWFTMTVHWKEIGRRAQQSASGLRSLRPYAAGVGIVLSVLPFVDYRWWFVYVGLIFPALAILTEVRRAIGRKRSHTLAIAAFVIVLTPFCFGAFLLQMEWLAVVPVAALVLALFGGQPTGGSPNDGIAESTSEAAVNVGATVDTGQGDVVRC